MEQCGVGCREAAPDFAALHPGYGSAIEGFLEAVKRAAKCAPVGFPVSAVRAPSQNPRTRLTDRKLAQSRTAVKPERAGRARYFQR